VTQKGEHRHIWACNIPISTHTHTHTHTYIYINHNIPLYTHTHTQKKQEIQRESFASPTQLKDRLPVGAFNVKTGVHEYGGGAYHVSKGVVFFSNGNDQRLYVQTSGDSEPFPVTPASKSQLRFADGFYDARRNRFYCVCEDHSPLKEKKNLDKKKKKKKIKKDTSSSNVFATSVRNSIVCIQFKNNFQDAVITTVVEGHDFYSNPRLNPNRSILSYLACNAVVVVVVTLFL